MIRRLVLFQPVTTEEADAATKVAAKMCDADFVISYAPSPTAMRLLLFDALSKPSKNRRVALNMIKDAADADGQPARVMRAAVATRQAIFNVVVGNDDKPERVSNMADTLFTVALPSGHACAFLMRDSPLISDASKAAHCMWRAYRSFYGERVPDEDVRSLFWPKKRPRDRHASELRVIAYVERLLLTVPGG